MPRPDSPTLAMDRARFLRGGLAAAAAVAGGLASPRGAALAAGPSPFDLRFEPVARTRPFDLLPARFRQVRMDLAGGAPAAARGPFVTAAAGPAAPYAAAVLDLVAPGPGAAVALGLVRGPGDFVVAAFEPGGDGAAPGTAAIDVAVGGRRTRIAAAPADLRGATRVAFALTENHATALIDRGGGGTSGWEPLARARPLELVDFRDPAVLGASRYGFTPTPGLAAFEAGPFGEAGLRDPHAVTRPDGTPVIREGKLLFTATHAGLGFSEAAHWGVWALDLGDPGRVECLSKLFFARDGLVLGDHAGHVVLEEGGGFLLAVSGWGDFAFRGLRVHHARTGADLLAPGGVHVIESEPLALPTGLSTWDPSLARVGGAWHVGYVESPKQEIGGYVFHPALARGEPGAPFPGELRRVGADDALTQTEGVTLRELGGRPYLLASDGEARRYRVYDLAMRRLGFLDAPYGTNIPHPQVVPVPAPGGRTGFLMLTFDGTPWRDDVLGYGTHGDLVVMRADRTF